MGSYTHGSHPFFVYCVHKGGSPDVGSFSSFSSFGNRHPAGHPQSMVTVAMGLHLLDHPEQPACKRVADKKYVKEVKK